MLGFLSMLKPVGIIVLKTVVREVFSAEDMYGDKSGKNKLGYVLDAVDTVLSDSDEYGGEYSKNITVDLVEFINAVVEILNQLGLLDDEPGADIADINELIKSVFKAIKEAGDVLRHFDKPKD
jgi:hypothetical protein